ncbi:MAG: TIGR04211 family SH3 domain-containing protein [Candidatus Competibacteraceae bacterium]|uniref:SH3b domain-containing protein n=1 Tax=Candidatus Contendobacter odensis Run_B_J11 TaxID=1400861 RepID=A0A7U7J358_9GAMM|nr:TIGR04211 family SH3 domain-containing protein [Candidatus Contendobacter odensis]MBK8535560.1 TIGR04211 family SH3 domain-containing protein [Candidatus Competibacteraceae bacterium]MBK8755367.1 TIGR04211 family SH3 domain-containing protein [Candidatus Competibacteraceae bacterium]CDH44002.1 exported hypothetical protein [Candidatus Contendobacter odensis Run_B_J11]
MKIPFIFLLAITVGVAATPVLAGPQSTPPPPSATYIIDALEIPLRAGASERYKVIGSVRGGSPVTVLKVDAAKGYTQIRSSAGVKGWLPSAQLTQTPGNHEQLVSARQELEQLKARHTDLQQHMESVVNKPGAEALSYPQLYEEALRLRQQMAEYRKVAADTVAIDERNKALQERTVTLERELRIVQQDNQTLRNDNGNLRFLMGAIILGTCLLVAVMVPRLRERKRAQWSRL